MFTGIVEGTGTVRTAERRGDILVVRVDVEQVDIATFTHPLRRGHVYVHFPGMSASFKR